VVEVICRIWLVGKKNDNNTYYRITAKKGLPEQNLLLDESQEKIWD
jgi:hypothetical protein